MSRSRLYVVAGVALIGATAAVGGEAARAAPLPTAFNANANGSVVELDVSALGASFVDANIGYAAGALNSTGAPRATSTASNLAAVVPGLAVTPATLSQTAPPDNATPNAATLTSINVPGVLTSGVISGSAHARWIGDATCPASGTNLTQTTTTLASAIVGAALAPVANVGAASVQSTTQLLANGNPNDARSVVSTSTATLSTISLLGGAVNVTVAGPATATASAAGVPGGATTSYTAPVVTVNGSPLAAGGTSTPINVPLVGSVTVSMGTPTVVTTPNGLSASIDVDVLTVSIALLTGGGTVQLSMAPLHADATAPPGAVECLPDLAAPAAPVITYPGDGLTIGTNTPTVRGTGEPGATVAVTIDNTPIGSGIVDVAGNWSVPTTTPLANGQHVAVAVQTDAAGHASPPATSRFNNGTAGQAAYVEPGSPLQVHVPEGMGGKILFGQLTVDLATAPGFVTAYGCAGGVPRDATGAVTKSDLNYDGRIEPVASNRLVVTPDVNGNVCFYPLNRVALIVDFNAVSTTGIAPLANQRTDTRTNGVGQVGPRGELRVHVNGAEGGKTVIGQLTVDQVTGPGFVTAYGCADGIPRDAGGLITKSDVNYDGRVQPFASNRLIVTADVNGFVCFSPLTAAAIIVDVSAVSTDGITSFPNRRTDTRLGQGVIPAGGTLRLHVAGAEGNKVVLGQLTADLVRDGGFITAYPCLAGLPRDSSGAISKSDLNYNGRIRSFASNRLIVGADASGEVCFYNLTSAALVIDVSAVSATAITQFPNQRTDTRLR